ncbi:TlyA family RNA methyltransferase [Mycetocola zhadangensis]|uniref:TlyA family RNA methyltransferase n=1 Tax=Mycetocola zhadangensis TaxID=1164595 RepID=A0A3L7J733_9MICO|nr:TlyA family RNA methyltransferase [Mycetocola zhadangensis]RLQ86446.1 TlyA family RNA methyltransferase [Mycetocola zhadangensis]GGE91299.1 TlyA family rRNA (cytidine-2'-O)-methyltransferase [Mycetocola zhadangensis]
MTELGADDVEQRLDAALVTRGHARSRTLAARLIADGLVTVNGRAVVKPAAKVRGSYRIEVAGTDHYVSRGAHKLLGALDAFGVDPTGRLALDAGASTGGFTQVLLERGARHVIALDVGHGQLAPEIANDPRVSVIEGFNVRDLTPENLAGASAVSQSPNLIVGDLSFISLTHVLGPLQRSAAPDSDFLMLIKPQFEVGRGGIREGIVRNDALRADAIASVLWHAWDLGLGTAGLIESPIVGGHGNREYLVWLRSAAPDVNAPSVAGRNPTEWLDTITEIAGA